jgi:hypothetical protein
VGGGVTAGASGTGIDATEVLPPNPKACFAAASARSTKVGPLEEAAEAGGAVMVATAAAAAATTSDCDAGTSRSGAARGEGWASVQMENGRAANRGAGVIGAGVQPSSVHKE